MSMSRIIQLAEKCREQRRPPRCAECVDHGAVDCPWSLETTPNRAPKVRHEETMEERVRRLFAAV